MVVTHPTSSLSINDNRSPACSAVEGCLSLSYLCNVFSVVGVVFDGMEKRQRLMDHDVSFSGFWNIQEVFVWLNIIFVNKNSSKYSWPGYILPSQTKRLLNSSCDPNLTSNLTLKKCNVKPYPSISFPNSHSVISSWLWNIHSTGIHFVEMLSCYTQIMSFRVAV